MKKNKFLWIWNIAILVAILLLGAILVFEILEISTFAIYVSSLIFIIILFFLFFFYLVTFYDRYNRKIKLFYKNLPEIAREFEINIKNGYLLYDKNKNITFISELLWLNGFSPFIGKGIDKLNIKNEDEKSSFVLGNKAYAIKRIHKYNLLIISDQTDINSYLKLLENKTIAVILINKHFSAAVRSNDFDKLKINLNINEYLKKWSIKHNAIFRTEGNLEDNILIIGRWKDLKVDIENEILINKLMEILKDKSQNISISIGAAYGDFKLDDLLESALKAVETSKNRGGNQVVLVNKRGLPSIIGKSSLQVHDNSKLEIKIFNDNFVLNVQKFNRILLFSHKKSDLDSIASAIGISKFLSDFDITTNIVIDEFDNSAQKLFKDLSPSLKELFVSPESITEKIDNKTGAIILDISDKSRVQHYEIIERVSLENRFLIDHHRVGTSKVNIPDMNSYIDISASSVSEIITELFLFKKNMVDKSLTQEEASLLILGIYLDTNSLKRNVSAHTYEALSFLSSDGVNLGSSLNYIKNDFLDIPLTIEALKNAVRLKPNIIFSNINENKLVDDSSLSYLADMLLNFEGIDASFIVAKMKSGIYKVSARSNGTINVQVIAELLGGGGHYNISAAVFEKSNIRYKNLRKKIKDTIIESLEKEKNKK